MKLFARWILIALTLLTGPTWAAGKGDTFENDVLKLIFQATAIANVADNAASSPLTTLYLGLHTGDPGEAGNCTTNETSYTSYARVAVARSGSGFTVTGSYAGSEAVRQQFDYQVRNLSAVT